MATKCTPISVTTDLLKLMMSVSQKGQTVAQRLAILSAGYSNIAERIDAKDYPLIFDMIEQLFKKFPIAQITMKNYKDCFKSNFDPNAQINQGISDLNQLADLDAATRKSEIKRTFFFDRFGQEGAKAEGYYKRTLTDDLINAFLVDRKNGKLVTEKAINANVRALKQEYLDRIKAYIEYKGIEAPGLDNMILFPNPNLTSDILGPSSGLKLKIDELLNPNNTPKKNLFEAYKAYKNKAANWQGEKMYLDAYNAWISLLHFDTLLDLMLPGMVSINATYRNQLTHKLEYKTNLDKATNMWAFGYGDDNEDIADLVSEVTQLLIQSSKYYKWKSNTPMDDKYLSFLDFNDIIGKVKGLANTMSARGLALNVGLEGYNNLTPITKKILKQIKALNKEQLYLEADLLTGVDPTIYQLVSMISRNPQDYLHAIFDILCNTSALASLVQDNNAPSFSDIDKNVIWSLGKEIFGHTNETEGISSRSIFDLHENTRDDSIYEIVTQIADSMFSEEYLQYYQDLEGKFQTQKLKDYSINELRRQIKSDIQESGGMIDDKQFANFKNKYGVFVKTTQSPIKLNRFGNPWKIDGEEYKADIISFIKAGWEGFSISVNPKGPNKPAIADAENLWKSSKFRDFVKDLLGIDLNSDVDYATALEELYKEDGFNINYDKLCDNLSRLCGTVLFNLIFNSQIRPKVLSGAGKSESSIKAIQQLVDAQYSKNNSFYPSINKELGIVYLIPGGLEATYLKDLAEARAINYSLTTAALVKTGEGTALANFCLSRLRNSYHYQLAMLMRNAKSATRDTSFVTNTNGLFKGVMTAREVKTDQVAKASTEFSSTESYQLSFVNDWISAFIKNKDRNTYLGAGLAALLPTVNSDKSQIDRLLCNLYAKSKYSGKSYIDMTDADLEQEMRYELGPTYTKIIDNISNELTRITDALGITLGTYSTGIERNRAILDAINHHFGDPAINKYLIKKLQKLTGESESDITIKYLLSDSSRLQLIKDIYIKDNNIDISNPAELKDIDKKAYNYIAGKAKVGKAIEAGLHKTITKYNNEHTRNPIQVGDQIHFITNKKTGFLETNKTLEALWGRYAANKTQRESLCSGLYNSLTKGAASVEGFFKLKDIETAMDLLKDGFVMPLRGKAAHNLKEILFLRGEKPGSNGEIDPESELSNWIMQDGTMTIVKLDGQGYSNYNEFRKALATKLNKDVKGFDIVKSDLVKEAFRLGYDIQLHPMMSRMNRMSYLAGLQYMNAVGGATYVYKGEGADVLEEEAARWLASNKRNVCYASTVHKFQGNTLNGNPEKINIAIVKDIKADVYNIMGDLSDHKPIDGGMFGNGFFEDIENNSLGGERAGADQKTFGTFMFDEYSAGGIIKTAKFVCTNDRMRNNTAWRHLQENMSRRAWTKEFAGADGRDILEDSIDINLDYRGNRINYGTVFYMRTREDGQQGLYRLAKVNTLYLNTSGENVEIELSSKCPEYAQFMELFKRIPTYGELIDYIKSLGYKGTNSYNIYEIPVNELGNYESTVSPQLRGSFTINNNWDLFTTVFGGYNSLLIGSDGRLTWSENSRKLMAKAINEVGYKKDYDHAYVTSDGTMCYQQDIDVVRVQDDYWQPLKNADIHYVPNEGAIKSTYLNLNPKEAMSEVQANGMNFFRIPMALLGIQLDKEHHADEAELSMPTQIIQACANKSYTISNTSELYKALSALTEFAIEDCIKGVEELLPGNINTGKLLTEVSTIIVDLLIHGLSDDAAIRAAMEPLIKKVEKGGKLSIDDIYGKVPFSDGSIYNQIYNKIASSLTNSAIKMKFDGVMSVICPTEEMWKIYGDRQRRSFTKIENGADSEEVAMKKYLEEILQDKTYNTKTKLPNNKYLIYDITRSDENLGLDDLGADAVRLQTLISRIQTQHNYIVEYEGMDPTNPHHMTINTPKDYFEIKDILLNGFEIEEEVNGLKQKVRKPVTRIYEDVQTGRTLGAYNVRFADSEGNYYNIFDVDSVANMFEINEIPTGDKDIRKDITDPSDGQKNLEKYQGILKKFSQHQAIFNKMNIVLSIVNKQLGTNYKSYDEIPQNASGINAIRKAFKILLYKEMEKDLFRLSKNYSGIREVYANGRKVTADSNTFDYVAYELIMPKIYQTQFGLQEFDDVQEILADENFFTKRAIEKLSGKNDKISSNHCDYVLRCMNGKHIYIIDRRNSISGGYFRPNVNFLQRTNEDGSVERIDQDGETMYQMASAEDKVLYFGDTDAEVIVTDNPEFYMDTIPSALISFSNLRVRKEQLQRVSDNLKNAKSKAAKKFYRALTTKRGELRPISSLQARNNAIDNLSLDRRTSNVEMLNLIDQLEKQGRELHAAFNKSLDIIAARIPAQSLQSFMSQRVVAFDTKNINTAMVSTFLLFLQGSKEYKYK